MNRRTIYLFVAAEDAASAINEVETRLNEWREREWYDDFTMPEELCVMKPEELLEAWKNAEMRRMEEMLQLHTNRMVMSAYMEYPADDKRLCRIQAGLAMQRAGEILAEHFSPGCPWFNLEEWDFTFPKEGSGCLAVPVEFEW